MILTEDRDLSQYHSLSFKYFSALINDCNTADNIQYFC